jgi:hypothetical protein
MIGIQGVDQTYPGTHILSISAGPTDPNGRSHIFFQDSTLHLQRYDITGRGANATLISEEQLFTATPGTWISTWAESNYCGEQVDVFFQRDNTSDIHYLTFQDSYSPSYNSYKVYTVTNDAIVVDVATCGIDVASPKHNRDYEKRVWAGVGALLGIGVVLFLFGLYRCWKEWPKWQRSPLAVTYSAPGKGTMINRGPLVGLQDKGPGLCKK